MRRAATSIIRVFNRTLVEEFPRLTSCTTMPSAACNVGASSYGHMPCSPSGLPRCVSIHDINLVTLRGFASAPQPAPADIQQPNQDRTSDWLTTANAPTNERHRPPPIPIQPSEHAAPIRVEAFYVGSRIDVYDFKARPELRGNYTRFHKGTAIIGIGPQQINEKAEAEGLPMGPYLVATSYGSAVFFNVDSSTKQRWLALLREVAAEPITGDRKYTEEYTLAIAPELPTWSQLEPECVRLRTLDLKNLQVVAQVLAQSVALDYYSSHVERTLETFCAMNGEMAESASIARVDKAQLLRLVAENNIVMTEIISKLGVHERYDIAWKDVRYGRVWEFLRAELEMEPRFETLDMKLNLIQDNLKYFLEILQARKSDFLEWTIIVLIAVEICLSLYELGSRGLFGA